MSDPSACVCVCLCRHGCRQHKDVCQTQRDPARTPGSQLHRLLLMDWSWNYTEAHRPRPAGRDAKLEANTLCATDCVNAQLNDREHWEKDQKHPFIAECWPSLWRQIAKEIAGEEIQFSFIFLKPSSFIFSHLYNLFLCDCSLALSNFFHHGDHSLSVIRYPDMVFLYHSYFSF